ncbi:NADH dehydrogenase [ubiquinone] 1 alpha subcomplex assembly factor 3 [Amborella trichopoda]|uniref:NADH dehydrogenase [ubiquinone] 1 alpha subcomplex assembly factor 3 n=1 Tax=Amborella trichopoda TaxID=13333 RepID=UPI0005D2E34D|nr:NADH dehydrogenase [ubiquinone] 1 alpha subcomplex assembly factor 3 [Amborella trichopoda]|eukprot:XP_011624585.1 NADH dehydrogenase [ubiquinone] 1 alpha subcomplex assembly factor 3 [Amborella trichopoda]
MIEKLVLLRRVELLYLNSRLLGKLMWEQLQLSFETVEALLALSSIFSLPRFSDTGFTINGVQYEGSVLCVGSLVLSWSPKKLSEITADSLSVLQLLRPAPEIFVLGCGRFTVPIDPELMRFIRSNGMKLEAIDSRNAASTFNILNEEGRMVAAALLPYRVQE